MSSSSSTAKVCFNSNCKGVLERSGKGWRCRTGDFAELCDRCSSAYEDGKFCETFHLNASGWRCCESCRKQIHCGCIVSFHMFVLLDAGGIECINCARKSFILTPNPAWPPPSLFLPAHSERIKDLSTKNWSSIAGSGLVPWRQTPSLFNGTSVQSDLHPRLPFEVDISGGIDQLFISDQLSVSSLEKKKEDPFERLVNGSPTVGTSKILENGNAGIKCEEQFNSCVNVSQSPVFSKNDPSTPHFSLHVTSALKNETNDQTKVSGTNVLLPTPSPPAGKQLCSRNDVDASGEAQIHNGRTRGDVRGRSQLLPRYWPRITDQELQQISGDSKSVITPLFEKMLSASDAGRIGRLVLPKRCAEAYFPPISQPEGLPLKVQDLKGKEWVFQFRFWPNNNSRMYVLEGVTPCIQSMQLQAGDIVTFSRVEPKGKLVMGCRKASIAPPSDQGNEVVSTSNKGPTHGDVITRISKPGEVVSTHPRIKVNSVSLGVSSVNQTNFTNTLNTLSEVDNFGCMLKEVPGVKPSSHSKRKSSTLGSKSKRLRIETEDMLELKVTWAQAQGLFRSPPNDVPHVVVIEGLEVEEYEDAPIIGRPTIFATDHVGGKIQWAQCEECFKWRKVPANALLPSRWTCSDNSWDPERSLCSAAQELTSDQLEDLLPNLLSTSYTAASKKMKAAKQVPESIEAMEGLDTLANLAIQEGETVPASSQATTKHPRHRSGCSCIVCIQPPSGKGPKHKPTCTCSVCESFKRRFRTLMMKREKKQSDKEAETTCQKLEQLQSPERLQDEDIQLSTDIENSSQNHNMASNEGSVDDQHEKKSSTSHFKGQIDLNIQPEREEELSPSSDSGGMMRLHHDATERYVRQHHSFSSSGGNRISIDNQIQLEETGGGKISNTIAIEISQQNADVDADHHSISKNALASTSDTGR